MVAIINRDLCTGCGQCVETCPVEAISLDDEEVAIVDSELCVDCSQCVDVCPMEAILLD
jgi:Fe-S-cluster-containing hydrogenase component 2